MNIIQDFILASTVRSSEDTFVVLVMVTMVGLACLTSWLVSVFKKQKEREAAALMDELHEALEMPSEPIDLSIVTKRIIDSIRARDFPLTDPQITHDDMVDYAVVGIGKMADGHTSEAKFNDAMIKEFGLDIKLSLPVIYKLANEIYTRTLIEGAKIKKTSSTSKSCTTTWLAKLEIPLWPKIFILAGIVLCIIALIDGAPATYYNLFRCFEFGLYACLAYFAYIQKRERFTFLFGTMSVLYNPLFKIHLDELWPIPNVFSILVLSLLFILPVDTKRKRTVFIGLTALALVAALLITGGDFCYDQ